MSEFGDLKGKKTWKMHKNAQKFGRGPLFSQTGNFEICPKSVIFRKVSDWKSFFERFRSNLELFTCQNLPEIGQIKRTVIIVQIGRNNSNNI